jgi:hypothetical protein
MNPPTEVSKLMSLTDKEWIERSTDALNEKMALYSAQCVPPKNNNRYGF